MYCSPLWVPISTACSVRWGPCQQTHNTLFHIPAQLKPPSLPPFAHSVKATNLFHTPYTDQSYMKNNIGIVLITFTLLPLQIDHFTPLQRNQLLKENNSVKLWKQRSLKSFYCSLDRDSSLYRVQSMRRLTR